jgi:hypothetical protein
MQSFLMLKQVVHTVTRVLERVKRYSWLVKQVKSCVCIRYSETHEGAVLQRKQSSSPARQAKRVCRGTGENVGVHTQIVIDIKQERFKLQWYFGNILNQFADNLNIGRGYMPYQGTKRFPAKQLPQALNNVQFHFTGPFHALLKHIMWLYPLKHNGMYLLL